MHLIFKSLFFALNPKLSKSCDSYSCVHKRNSHPSKVLRSLQKNMVILCHGREIGYRCWGVSLKSSNHKINLCTFSLYVVDCSSTIFNLMVFTSTKFLGDFVGGFPHNPKLSWVLTTKNPEFLHFLTLDHINACKTTLDL